MIIGEIVAVGGLVFTFAASQWGIYKYFDGRLTKQNSEHDVKIARIYERLDEHKKNIDDKYVMRNICEVLHKSTVNNLEGVEKRLDERLSAFEMRLENTFKSIDLKITALLSKP